jgi:signal transduction histidine kinase
MNVLTQLKPPTPLGRAMPVRPNLSIRLKLAAFFTIAVALILAGAGIVTYQLLRHSLLAEISRDVATRTHTFQANHPGPPYDLDTFSAPDVFIQIQTGDGTVTARSANLAGRSLPLPDAARRGQVAEVRLAGRPLFLAAAALPDGGYVVVARSPVTTYRALASLQRLLTLVVAAAMLLTALASWGYARVALRPIERVVDAARAVRDSRDLTRRVTRTRPRDEVGRLIDTFNAMLTELEAAHQALDASNQQMRRFLADCSHELRAPLARIRTAADLLTRLNRRDEADDGENTFRSQALADIADDTDRMARRVRELLILARADAGATIDPRPVHLGQVLTAACRHAERMASTGVRLVVEPDTQRVLDQVTVAGDPDYLQQVLLILLDNAFKYTPPPGHVDISARLNDRHAEISIADSGLGIPPEDTERIFERFYRGRNAAATTGTGLGLAIAAWVITQHGGDITLTSTPGIGSRFTIRLPTNDDQPSMINHD